MVEGRGRMTDSDSMVVRPAVAGPNRRPPTVAHQPEYAEADSAYQQEYIDALARLIAWAHADGIEIAEWLRNGLTEASCNVGGMAVLLARRPGSWEAALGAALLVLLHALLGERRGSDTSGSLKVRAWRPGDHGRCVGIG
jgi:hypothetical protein